MASNPAPCCKKMRSQATDLWPKRSQLSDGIVPSPAHTQVSPNSDHEVGKAGYNHAVDLTHDPAHGCDCDAIAELLRVSRDKRIKYVIRGRRIFSSYEYRGTPAWTWRPYGGVAHTKHMHVSVLDTKAACEDISPWALKEVEKMIDGYWYVVGIFNDLETNLPASFKEWADANRIACTVSGRAIVCHGNDVKSKKAQAKFEEMGATCPFGRLVTIQNGYKAMHPRNPY